MGKRINSIQEKTQVLEKPVRSSSKQSEEDDNVFWIEGTKVYYENGEIKVDYREDIKNTKYKPVEEMRKIAKAVLYLKGKYLYGCNLTRPSI